MCFDNCYSFCLYEQNGKPLFSASFFSEKAGSRVELESVPVKEEELASLLKLISENDLVKKTKSFRKPKLSFEATDEADYSLSIYSDIGNVFAELHSKKLEDFFFELAGKYI